MNYNYYILQLSFTRAHAEGLGKVMPYSYALIANVEVTIFLKKGE